MTNKLLTSQVPQNWIKTRLDCIAEIVLGQSPPSSTYNESGKGLPFYQGKLEFGKVYPIPQKWCADPKKTAEKGDVLLSVRAPVGPTNICPEKSCIGRGLAAVRGLCGIETLFILYLLRANENVLVGKGTGTTFSAISGEQLRSLEIPLPPLNEQRRIVEKVEELFSFLDAGVESLRKVQAQLKRYRQAVLKYAFEGKLTEEWRKTHKDQIEPAQKLFEKIMHERRVEGGEKYNELPPLDSANLPKLPENWVWIRPGDFARINPGFPSGKHNSTGLGVPHIRPMNINVKGKIELTEIKYVQPKAYYDSLSKGDVIFNNTNSAELLGKTAYIKENTNWAYSNHMTRLRFNNKNLNPAWVSYYLHNLFLTGFFKMNCAHHVNQASINSTFLAQRVVIPLPPLIEQDTIIEEMETNFSILDKTMETIYQNLKKSKHLRQSILNDAFLGLLVPQDPSDEPAGKLLDRIKSERLKRGIEGSIGSDNYKSETKKQVELSRYVK